jgi:RNA polymerase sigma-70 factor (ECF subfamily)
MSADQLSEDDHFDRDYLDWIGRVSPASRAALLLHYEQHLSLEETAAILDVLVGTVKSRLSYGLASIRNLLKEKSKQ